MPEDDSMMKKLVNASKEGKEVPETTQSLPDKEERVFIESLNYHMKHGTDDVINEHRILSRTKLFTCLRMLASILIAGYILLFHMNMWLAAALILISEFFNQLFIVNGLFYKEKVLNEAKNQASVVRIDPSPEDRSLKVLIKKDEEAEIARFNNVMMVYLIPERDQMLIKYFDGADSFYKSHGRNVYKKFKLSAIEVEGVIPIQIVHAAGKGDHA